MKPIPQEEIIYNCYPKKVGKKLALKSIQKSLKEKSFEALQEATIAYAVAVSSWPENEKQYVPMPATWFNQGRYDDDRVYWNKEIAKRPTHFAKSKKKFIVRRFE